MHHAYFIPWSQTELAQNNDTGGVWTTPKRIPFVGVAFMPGSRMPKMGSSRAARPMYAPYHLGTTGHEAKGSAFEKSQKTNSS